MANQGELNASFEPTQDSHPNGKYGKIVSDLRESITSGKYRDGARLPSEAELIRKYAVSRMTVVKAMRRLQEQGLLVRKAGSGSFAAQPANDQKPIFGLIIPVVCPANFVPV